MEMYDSTRAKIAANLRWLFAKAYGIDHIPEDLRDPFNTDHDDQEQIKPSVIHLLLSSELYCRVCTLILKTEQAASLQSHLLVIQALTRNGISVVKYLSGTEPGVPSIVEIDGTPVTNEDLTFSPIKMSAHMSMINALMMAYTVEVISVEKMVTSPKFLSTSSASEKLLDVLNNTLIFWINKVRYYQERVSGQKLPFFPLLEDLMRDVSDGAALLTVVHYYCPDLMKLEDICLKEVPSNADKRHNIQLLRDFVNKYLNKSFYLTIEDMFYSPPVLKHNVMAFIAELFWWFEIVKSEFVKPTDLHEFKDALAFAQPKSARPSVPISNATKRSFLASPGMADNQSSPEVCNSKQGPTFFLSHSLLPLRQKQQKQQHEDGLGLGNRSNSLTQMDGQTRGSVVAWPDNQAGCTSTTKSSMELSSREPPGGIHLHSDVEEPKSVQGLDSDLEDLDEEEENLDEAVTTEDSNWPWKDLSEDNEEEESARLRENMNVKEHVDKDMNSCSGRSGPCLSVHSQASSMASGSVRMTSFAERKAQQQRFGSNHHICSSANGASGGNVLASEIVQLRIQLGEKRRAIEYQKKKMEVLSARQRQKLGKAAFLHIVKKGGGKTDTLSNPCKADISKDDINGEKGPSSKDEICVDALREDKDMVVTTSPGALEADKKGNNGSFYLDEELDLNECSRSIELLNDAISSIQQQMMQLSLQQEMLMKQNVQSPPGAAPPPPLTCDKNSESKAGSGFHYVEHISGTSTAPTRKPLKLSSGQSSTSKPSELKRAKEQSRPGSRTLTSTQIGSESLSLPRHLAGGRSPRTELPDSPRNPSSGETIERPGPGHIHSAAFPLHDQANMRLPTRVDLATLAAPDVSHDERLSSTMRESELNSSDGSGKENIPSEEAHLIEVHLSDLKDLEEEDTTREGGDGEQKSAMAFFFKDERKSDDQIAKKRAAFMLRQKKKAEETRLRKQQLKAESELRRDEARQKAEEERWRKAEKMRQEQIRLVPKTFKPNQEHRPEAEFRVKSSEFVTSGPKLFKEISGKSNKPIIHNAISHCCLAGKVNEPQRKQILEELEYCESNHLMILFRDVGCQFRALYSYFPDTEEIQKLTGSGPKSISKKMIDKLYKYTSDRKQFTIINGKTLSLSVDALTIHSHLWQTRRGVGPKESGN